MRDEVEPDDVADAPDPIEHEPVPTETEATEEAMDEETASEPSELLSLEEVAREVAAGKWGVGQDRRLRLAQAGYDHKAVAKAVIALRNN